MLKHITLYYLLIWMTVSQAAFCQGERSSLLMTEDNALKPIYGKFEHRPPYPDMLAVPAVQELMIARTEITVYQYRVFCEATQRAMPKRMPSWGWREQHPVVYISLEDAQDYCKWLTVKTGLNYRLPTIEEWEKAVGRNEVAATLKKIAWFGETDSSIGTKTVATKAPNAHGIYDMFGNVWEWCQPVKGNVKTPVKGGSWNRAAAAISKKNTEWVPAQTRSLDIGFRPVVELQ